MTPVHLYIIMLCGSCMGAIAALVAADIAQERPRMAYGLFVGAFVLVLVLPTLLLPPTPTEPALLLTLTR